MAQRSDSKTQTAAAAKAGISERTAQRIDAGQQVGGGKPRHWRTRQDPFAEVWEEVADELTDKPDLQALTLLEWLQGRYPEKYPDHLLRSLQRRVKAWRARHRPDKEVMFPQHHEPGQRGLSDFTTLKDVTVTVCGDVLDPGSIISALPTVVGAMCGSSSAARATRHWPRVWPKRWCASANVATNAW